MYQKISRANWNSETESWINKKLLCKIYIKYIYIYSISFIDNSKLDVDFIEHNHVNLSNINTCMLYIIIIYLYSTQLLKLHYIPANSMCQLYFRSSFHTLKSTLVLIEDQQFTNFWLGVHNHDFNNHVIMGYTYKLHYSLTELYTYSYTLHLVLTDLAMAFIIHNHFHRSTEHSVWL